VAVGDDVGQTGASHPKGDDAVVRVVTAVVAILSEVAFEIVSSLVNELDIGSCLSGVLPSQSPNQIIAQLEMICKLTERPERLAEGQIVAGAGLIASPVEEPPLIVFHHALVSFPGILAYY
jgi:hypothetical protein